jgi:hypothetical protein
MVIMLASSAADCGSLAAVCQIKDYIGKLYLLLCFSTEHMYSIKE